MLSKLSLEDIQKPLLLSGAILASGLAAYYVYKNYTNDIKWEEAGEVCQLLIHPVKSARAVDVKRAFAGNYGLSNGNMLDRSFIILCENEMVTGRTMPRLVTIVPKIEGQTLTLTSNDGQQFSVDIGKVVDDNVLVKFKLRCTMLHGFDCGKDVGSWLGNLFKTGDKQLQLIYKGANEWERPCRTFPANYPEMKANDVTIYQDTGAYMIMTKSSLDDLNSRLEKPVDVHYFRPPILIKGPKPYDEDSWSHIKIGESVILRVFKPCERCLLTQRVPTTGEQRSDHFEVLKSYRLLSWPPDVAKQMAGRPIVGAHCGIDSTGEIVVGDKVYVRRQKKPWWKIGILKET